MGFGNMVAGAAVDAAAKQAEMKRMMKGRTPEQQSVIKYFYGAGGCLSKGLTDEPVSYTHLDVYKRQTQGTRQSRAG